MTMLNPCDLEIVTGGVLDNDYIEYLTRVMFYAKRADKTLDQVLSDLRNHGCTQEALSCPLVKPYDQQTYRGCFVSRIRQSIASFWHRPWESIFYK